jgi:mono/diheme cytochrome c family protein
MPDVVARGAGLVVAVFLSAGWVWVSGVNTRTTMLPALAAQQGNAERGRAVFNGKGVCYYCHGIDGNKDQRPQLAADTAALIAQLNPLPPDLRNRKTLRLTTDKARFNAIREGHPGTGMFPDTTMTDQEMTDTLTYLPLLRREGSSKGK